MPSVLLGTGASEGIPCVFCRCPVCTRARQQGGKEIRSRSAFLIDEHSMVDFSRDLFYQSLQSGVCLHELQRIFITHFHEDHVSVEEMGCRMSASPALNQEVDVFCSPPVAEQLQLLFDRFCDHNQAQPFNYFQKFKLRPVEPFETFSAGNLTVTPILSSHHGYGVGEWGYNYLFESDGKRFLYAVDTGWYRKPTWEFLAGKPLDFAVLECTYGNFAQPLHAEEHLDLANMVKMLVQLQKIGCITRETPVYLTHLCHLHTLSHDETQQLLHNCGFHVIVGWDGMRIETEAAGKFAD